MLRVIGCITANHDLRLVALAGLLCLLACFAAVGLVTRARATRGWWRHIWTAATGFVVGGAIWSTHFVAMLAFRPEIPFSYDAGLTFFSILIAISLSWIGTSLALKPRAAALGGALMGVAIVAMHYVGMAALNLPGTLHWDSHFIVYSIVVGIGLASLAVWLAITAKSLALRMLGGAIGAVAICGMHFTSMAGITIAFDPTIVHTEATVAPQWLAAGVFAITFMIVALALLGALFDHHLTRRAVREAERLRAYVVELEATKSKLEATTADLMTALEAAAAGSQAKSQFLATMSHELRTPLNAIIGFSEILATELFGPIGSARYREYAHDVKDSGSHLLSLINDILDFSKVDAGHLQLDEEPVDLGRVIEESLRMVQQQTTHQGVGLRSAVATDLPRLRADHRRIRQVLLNLLSNAAKFTPSGGLIVISAEMRAGGIVVKVADTGIGIRAEDIPKAMERFGQIDSDLNRKYQGTGLGLPLSKRLVELHGGTLMLESEIGVGTTVTAIFPMDRVLTGQQAA
ncbi:MAG: hypothetical protein K8R18_05800 [Parvibaculum sp.]|uniref:sensor histidine kinase n=1 Tax=Parvibaculum sp. TaxID=2024848 RepID=UPI0025CBCD8E|nr:MHYT domain-containing protein [Parvibaculum sp.]MCE9649126.1 hypothetical protein [Parvibaculum sp.]